MKIFFPKVRYYKIYDNFNIILVNTESNIFTASITIDIGSINEKYNELGLAHFYEHMIFKGTTNSSSIEISEKLDLLGTKYNASTGYNKTEYIISGNTKDYDIILNTLLDLFLNPIFPQQDIANELNVVLEEFRMYQDNKSRQTLYKLMELLYQDTDNKYSIPVIGKPEYISNLTRDNLLKFHTEKYLPANKILSIIGPIDDIKIINIIEKIFKTSVQKWHPKFINLDSKLLVPYYNKTGSYKLDIIKNPDINQFIVSIGFRSINNYSKWSLISYILEEILAGSITSRLFVLLRNKLGLTYYQNADSQTFPKHGYFYIGYGVQPDGLEISLKAVLKELFDFNKNTITDYELQKGKTIIETSLLFNIETNKDVGNYIISSVINKIDPNYLKKINSKINKITKKHIYQFVDKIFKKSNLFIVINGTDVINYDNIKQIIDDI